jgi:hypothetical protein
VRTERHDEERTKVPGRQAGDFLFFVTVEFCLSFFWKLQGESIAFILPGDGIQAIKEVICCVLFLERVLNKQFSK